MDRMRIGIIGGGPSGAYAAWAAAELRHEVMFFDHRAPWEKPCGGGVTVKAQKEFPWIADIACEGRAVSEFRFRSPTDHAVEFTCPEPLLIFSRSRFDEAIRERARAAGANQVALKAQRFERSGKGWRVDAEGERFEFDFLVGADGAVSKVRDAVMPDFPGFRNSIASGFFIPADVSRIETKFFPDSRGYLWFFPRSDHLSVGLCLWDGTGEVAKGRETRRKLIQLLETHFEGLDPTTGKGYGAFIPTIMDSRCWDVPRGAANWALVGDAGGFVDAVTGEGIFYALRSARAWGSSLKIGQPERYDEIWRAEFGPELMRATELVRRLYEPRFIERVIRLGSRSAGVRTVLSDVVMGTQSYVTLRKRLQGEIVKEGWKWLKRGFQPVVSGAR